MDAGKPFTPRTDAAFAGVYFNSLDHSGRYPIESVRRWRDVMAELELELIQARTITGPSLVAPVVGQEQREAL